MANFDDVIDAVRALKVSIDQGVSSLREIRDLTKQQVKAAASAGAGVGESVVRVEQPGTGQPRAPSAPTTPGAGGGGGAGGGKGNRPGLAARGAEYSANVAGDLANPFKATAETGLSVLGDAAKTGGAAVGGAIGSFFGVGATGARVGASLGGAAASAGLAEARFTVQSTKRDLLSTLSSLADQGIQPTREQAIQLRDAFKARAGRQKEALKLGADVLDKDFLGDVLGGGGGGASDGAETLKKIEENTRKTKGSGNPNAGATEDG